MNASKHDRSGPSSSMPLGKQGLAFCLGMLSLVFGFSLDEAFGGLAALLGMGLFCLVAQFFLLRGHRHAFLDVASIVILNCPLIYVFLVAGEFKLLLLLMVTVGCSFAGAMLASIVAMSGAKPAVPQRPP